MSRKEGKICARCEQRVADSGDWYGDLCPECADSTDGDWVCANCNRRVNFELMGGHGVDDPVCCELPCVRVTYVTDDIVENVLPTESTDSRPSLPIEFKLNVPTYNGNYFAEDVAAGHKDEFGDLQCPVLVHESEGVRVVLGTHDYEDMDKPDIQIERQPNGWMIFLRPLGGSDASGYVHFLDDGRSFLLKENAFGPTPPIEVIESVQQLKGRTGPKSKRT